ncbi:uncharacterized protein UV8b_02954 [Ustilaginoidea virens]|uniref:chitin deacetylase n=1 Tax=Ustilaginoidea virens TaxID=1159556 RepID=A0A063BUR1_USTVR|nr:uncharacterized protein UV8b_02954 [Ustilaginoidea virens]QUC18713.1 hypothetical protein UV8b_02954 [Ustilaginoidea virens]GAO15557.1 hypothetical protein UVI_02020330 [Ustilaginoidea virens]
MPRLALFRLPTKLRRQARRNRISTLAVLAAAAALLLLVLLPLYLVYVVYKPPRALIGYLRHKYPDVLFEVATQDKLVALSLDDAPSAHTGAIMDVLRASGARATFFVIGAQVPGREDTLRRLVREGHELANHGMRDEPASRLGPEQLAREAGEVRDALVRAYAAERAVLPNNYYRPGSGFFNYRMRDVLGRRGYRIALGSVYPHDPQIPYPLRNAEHILSMVHPGAIIICHDRREWTVPMLQVVLPELKQRGFRVVTISELVKTAEPLGGR